MSPIQRRTILFLILGVLLCNYQNCAYVGQTQGASSTNTASSATKQAQLESKAMAVIRAKCVGCHNQQSPGGGIDFITDVNSLKYYRLVLPGEPQLSELYDSVSKGRMPVTGTLTADQIKSLYDWINEGLVKDPGGVSPPPTGGGTLTGTFASINAKIIVPKCLGCHSAGNQAGGVNLSTYNGVKAIVQPGNPAASALYDSTLKNRMPKNGAPLSSQELQAISDWIISGALQN